MALYSRKGQKLLRRSYEMQPTIHLQHQLHLPSLAIKLAEVVLFNCPQAPPPPRSAQTPSLARSPPCAER
eukprot:2119998-Pleurochrysis_carterae.AAC.1